MSNSFFELELQEQRPSIALLFQDGLPTSLVSDYSGSKALSGLLACAADATDIDELSEITSAFHLDEIKILRVSEEAGSTAYFGPEFYPCLEEDQIFIFAISVDDGWLENSSHAVAYRFLWLLSCQKHLETWARLACYKLLLSVVGMPYIQPLPLRNQPPGKLHDWGFGPQANVAQVEAFSEHVKAYSGQLLTSNSAYLTSVKFWLQNEFHTFKRFDDLFEAYKE